MGDRWRVPGRDGSVPTTYDPPPTSYWSEPYKVVLPVSVRKCRLHAELRRWRARRFARPAPPASGTSCRAAPRRPPAPLCVRIPRVSMHEPIGLLGDLVVVGATLQLLDQPAPGSLPRIGDRGRSSRRRSETPPSPCLARRRRRSASSPRRARARSPTRAPVGIRATARDVLRDRRAPDLLVRALSVDVRDEVIPGRRQRDVSTRRLEHLLLRPPRRVALESQHGRRRGAIQRTGIDVPKADALSHPLRGRGLAGRRRPVDRDDECAASFDATRCEVAQNPGYDTATHSGSSISMSIAADRAEHAERHREAMIAVRLNATVERPAASATREAVRPLLGVGADRAEIPDDRRDPVALLHAQLRGARDHRFSIARASRGMPAAEARRSSPEPRAPRS